MTSPDFTTSTAITQLTPHTYSANFQPAWCIGSVPHGGYVTSTLQRAVALHFSTTLSKQRQPHCLALHLSFLRRTETGPALITIADAKLGARTSTVHVTLSQQPPGNTSPRVEIVGYMTHTNLAAETGVSLDTLWSLTPPPPPADVARLRAGTDELWAEQSAMPGPDFRKATAQVRFFFPRAGQAVPMCADQWVALKSGERWTNEALGFVADMFPQLLELPAYDFGARPVRAADAAAGAGGEAGRPVIGLYWYPTVLLNLDVKKALPAEGAEMLFVRVRAKTLKNGRYDLEVVVLDEGGEVVALSHHVCLAVSAERNLAARKRGGGGKEKL